MNKKYLIELSEEKDYLKRRLKETRFQNMASFFTILALIAFSIPSQILLLGFTIKLLSNIPFYCAALAIVQGSILLGTVFVCHVSLKNGKHPFFDMFKDAVNTINLNMPLDYKKEIKEMKKEIKRLSKEDVHTTDSHVVNTITNNNTTAPYTYKFNSNDLFDEKDINADINNSKILKRTKNKLG